MGIASIIGLDDLIGEIGKTARQLLPDPEAKREFQIKLEELRDQANERIHQEVLGQLEVNKIEAAHESIFVAGWRPAVGWCCVAGLGYNFVVNPVLLAFGASSAALPVESLITLVVTMLGASGIRTFERVKGVDGPLAASQPELRIAEIAAKGGEAPAQVPNDDKDAPWNKN